MAPVDQPDDQQRQPQTERTPRQVRAAVSMEVSAWKGPLPAPDDLRAYNEIIPNGAERIVAQFERETLHRHKLETRAQTFPLIDQILGRASALLFAFACLGLCGYAISQGAYVPATILGGAMIVAGVNAFMRRASKK